MSNSLNKEDNMPNSDVAEEEKPETLVDSPKPSSAEKSSPCPAPPTDETMNGSESDGEVDDAEEALFANLEHEEEEEAARQALLQPKDISVAPALLRKALEDGQVKADESEEESDKEVKKAESPEPHVHSRKNQLEFLLSKAEEYSNFIARDLDELQANLAREAEESFEGPDGKKRKRKGSAGATSKKAKAIENLKTAHAKDAIVRSEGKKAVFRQPPILASGCVLKDYQLEGVRWLASLYENGVSGILADEMGLGKTIQCIALIAHLLTKTVSGPFLIVAPLATLPNWVREFERWLPQFPVIRYHGTGPERDAMFKGPLDPKNKRNKDFPFIVTSYEVAIRDRSKLERLGEFTYLIVDEGHRLKNHRCTLLSSLKRLKAANRLLLTGTPIQNTLNELWSLLNFVNPGIFDDLTVFRSWFGFKDIGQQTHGATKEEDILLAERKNQTVTKLHNILRPFLLRRVKIDVLSELPPKKEVIVYSGISKLQAGYADLIEKGTLRDTLIRQGIEDGRTLSQHNKMMNLRKNTNHPFLFGEPIDPATGLHVGTAHPQLLVRASGKFALLDRMLDRLHRDGHQVLIFSQMTSVLNVMEDYLQFRKWNYCRIDGSTHIDERQRQMDVFNADQTGGADGSRNIADDRNFVFLLSTRAGGLGITLTAADTCIIFDSDWNPFADSQAMDRCHRIGQERPVAVYRLITTNSVDIEMMEKQVSKKKLERMTIAGGDFRRAGRRTQGDFTFESLNMLLSSEIKDMHSKGADVEDVKISDEEFDSIMDRKRLFSSGPDAPPSEGKMYDLIDAQGGDVLGSMDA
ncbi:hypothetical protein MPSEU_000136200 [Mayamaea pseudoterrestris]|nr:hypothetical protein MPSEU_000136200 [Mayamaea pseudoterrestris]